MSYTHTDAICDLEFDIQELEARIKKRLEDPASEEIAAQLMTAHATVLQTRAYLLKEN